MLFQSSIVKVIEFILFDPKKALYICFTSFNIITIFNKGYTIHLSYPFLIFIFFLKEIVIKSLIETSIVDLTFAAWFPMKVLSAVSKVNNVLNQILEDCPNTPRSLTFLEQSVNELVGWSTEQSPF